EKHTGVAFNGPGEVRLTVVAVNAAKDNLGGTVEVVLQYPSPWAAASRRGWAGAGIWPEPPRAANQMPTVQAFNAAGKSIATLNSTGYTDSSDDGLTMRQ